MKLTLKEKLLLLSISNKTGWSYASNFSYALAGAIILELVENKKLILSENRLVIRNTKSTGDIILDDVIRRIRKKAKKMVKEIKSSSEIGKAVDQTIREVNAAIIAAVTSSAAATAATSGK